jgi:hypothetical protein
MSGLALQDSGRAGKAGWMAGVVQRGDAAGVILSPFMTPRVSRPREKSAAEVMGEVADAGGTVVFDPTTNAALMPTTNAWSRYDTWDLWSGRRADISSEPLWRDHVVRALDSQVALGVIPLAPTLDLDSSVGPNADTSLDFAAFARSQCDAVALSIVGSSAFWAQGRLLDDYVGQIAQLRPTAVFLSVRRADLSYPPDAVRAEVAGLCRSVYSLSKGDSRSQSSSRTTSVCQLLRQAHRLSEPAGTCANGYSRRLRTA